jgi:hypothetical protein
MLVIRREWLNVVSDLMVSKFDRYSIADRRLSYQPFVAGEKPGGYSADEVNNLLMGVEQTFEAYLRRIERKLIDAQDDLKARQDELGKLANLADQRAAAAQAENAAHAAKLGARDQELAQIREQLNQQIEAAQKDRDTMTETAAQLTDRITSLEHTIEEIQQSSSWQLTRPLRWISDPKKGG